MSHTPSPLLSCHNLVKIYEEAGQPLKVLDGVNIDIAPGEMLAIVGSSGSGKSTLLHILGTLDVPSSGEVRMEGKLLSDLSRAEQARLRNQDMGFIYQFHHLLPEFSALENVAMPLMIGGIKPKEAKQRAAEMLAKVAMGHRADHRPSQLSGGERQRVAIARALVNNPKLVLADEPTGNLDHRTGEGIYQLLLSLRAELNTSFVVVTHDVALAARLDRSLTLIDGQLQQEGQ